MSFLRVLFCIGFITISSAYMLSDIKSAKIETCRGCSLNRLPEVKNFVMQDAPLYDRLQVKFISGTPPELVLLGDDDMELERLPLSNLNRQECNKLLENKGFHMIPKKEEF
ncbi:unnamed protein product [Pieris macdunnoughi]|uniref:Selenoprotein M n=1 Tax=Pieris macdunnoughi TaxID=345717 RepID=A0A821RK48_9NEOP|nr:unnamed protein product [Pieris macdunnoughi]